MKKFFYVFVLAAIGLTLTACSGENKEQNVSNINFTGPKVAIKTDKGEFSFILDEKNAPNSAKTFEDKSGNGEYNGRVFHRVEDWVVQGGDPLGNGTGGGNQKTELSQQPFTVGSVGIARGGDINISNDSQFFICKTDCSFLTGQYTYLGQVDSGMDVVNKIQIGDKINEITITK